MKIGALALWTVMELALAATVAAHPPYDHTERDLRGADGRPIHRVRSYVDGILFTDPVKLVVSDADDRTIAETEYGRDLVVLCGSSDDCVVFRYDGLAPVVPANVWRLHSAVRLEETGSIGVLPGAWG